MSDILEFLWIVFMTIIGTLAVAFILIGIVYGLYCLAEKDVYYDCITIDGDRVLCDFVYYSHGTITGRRNDITYIIKQYTRIKRSNENE